MRVSFGQLVRLLVLGGVFCLLTAAWSAPVQPDDSPGAIIKTADLNFGEIFSAVTANDVTLDPNGRRSASVPGTLGDAAGVGAAAFLLTGPAGASFHLFLPTRFTLSSTTDTMLVKDLTTTLQANHGTLGSDGQRTLMVGATLQVNANQTPGQYAGIFEVDVVFE